MRRNRKASLELSIRAIVIVILAMTLLGLGLGFIRTMFKDIGGISTDVTEQVRQQILDDLITNDKKLSFPKTQIVIDKGGSEILTVGIRNKGDDELCFLIDFQPIEDKIGNIFDITNWFQYAPDLNDACETIAPADATVKNMRLNLPRTVDSGSYFLQFNVIRDNIEPGDVPEYATKDFFIVVRG